MPSVSIRDLRNHGGDVIARVSSGESLTVTRDGTPVAQLVPVPSSGVSATALVEAMRGVGTIDLERFRADVDAVVDQSFLDVGQGQR